GLDFHLGLADSDFQRVAYLTRMKNDFGDAAAQRLFKATLSQPESFSARAFNNPPSIMTSGNKPEWRRMAQPAANARQCQVACRVLQRLAPGAAARRCLAGGDDP